MNSVSFVLILFAHVGVVGDENSNALSMQDGFISFKTCEAAGKAAQSLARGTVKEISFVCVSK